MPKISMVSVPLLSPYKAYFTTAGTAAQAEKRAAAQRAAARQSGSRVGFVVDILQLLVDQLGIDLGGRNVRVSQHLLDGVEIRAVFQQMGGKGVAQGVRGDFCLNSGLLLIVLDDLPKAWRLMRSPLIFTNRARSCGCSSIWGRTCSM